MNVPPQQEGEGVRGLRQRGSAGGVLERSRVFFATLGYASEVFLQKDKAGIGEDAVSAVIPQANIYLPFAELVDIEKEIERLKGEEKRLTGELARVNGMLNNEKFMSRAPEAKVAEERAKLEKIYPYDGPGEGETGPADQIDSEAAFVQASIPRIGGLAPVCKCARRRRRGERDG